jgi:AcrR family transcriptional regulator
MTRIASRRPARGYRSQLRVQQAEETRARILDATVRVMAGGIASVSIPAVAREAGVSVPTIYRHFGTKRDLLAAIYPHLARRVGLDRVPDPSSLDDLRDGIRAIFDRLDAFDDLARAAAASPAAEEARHVTMPDRFERISRFVDSIAPSLAKVDRDRIARLLVILTTSSALRVWRDHLGSSVDEASDDIDWMVRIAIASARSKDGR